MSKGALARHFMGRRVVVTGGSQGIGLALARQLASHGADLCLVARDPERLAAALALVEGERVRPDQVFETLACDTSDRDALAPGLEAWLARGACPDLLVNCVGYARPGYVEDQALQDFRQHMEINFFGQLTPTLLVLPAMLSAGRGHIVHVSSMLGFMGFMGYSAYCPSKYALAGLVEALRSELGHRGLRFSIVYPPDVDTPGFARENLTKPMECHEMSKGAGLLSPEEAARAILQGIRQGRFEIDLGKANFIHRMVRHFPDLVRAINDGDYRKARLKKAAGHLK